jgi:ABC-type glycerol-3-phosphate transport system substrate-binding protein
VVAALAFGVALLSAVAGVAAVSGGSASGKLSGTVTVWDFQYNSPEWGKALKQLDKEFMKLNPGVKIKHVGQPFDGYDKLLQTAFASRSGPDVVMLLPGYEGPLKWLPVLEPLNKRVTPKMLKDLAGWEIMSKDYVPKQGIYAVPTGFQGDVFYYNKALYRKAGLDPQKRPKTYQDIVRDLKALKAAGIQGLCDGNKEGIQYYWMFTSFWPGVGTGQEAYDLGSGKLKYTDPRVVDVVQKHLDLFEQGLTIPEYQSVPMWPYAEDKFANGYCGMFRGLASAAASWVQFNKGLGDQNVGVFQAPAISGSAPNFLPFGAQVGWSITKYSKVKDAAFAYAQFLTGTRGASVQLNVGGVLTNNNTVYVRKSLAPQVRQMLIDLKRAKSISFQPHGLMPPEIAAVWGPELAKAFAGKQTVAQALATIEAARKK